MPKKVGKYELGKTLGSGSFSKVKLALDDQGNQYAIKIIDKGLLAREHMEEQLKREIAVMKMMNHPNIVKLYDVMQTQNNIYIVLELVTGGELFEWIVSAKRFDEDTARKYFQQLVVGLYYCHTQGVAHRDLKPENLLLSDKDILKIMDFGLSNMQKGTLGKDENNGALLQTVCGTPNYVAPEVLKEKGYNGFTADVWSCGVILFVMCAGYLPFDYPNMNQLFAMIERGEYRMPKHFSESVQDLIRKLLVVDPHQRLTLEQVMKHPWFVVNFKKQTLPESNTLAPSAQQIQNWASSTTETQVANKESAKNGGGNVCGAFDILSQLTTGAITNFSLDNGTAVKRATWFFLSGTSNEVIDKVQEALAAAKNKGEGSKAPGSKPKEGTKGLQIKGFMNLPKGLLTYVIQIIPVVSGDMCMVEVRRGRGDTLDFHKFFHNLLELLGSSVLSKVVSPAGGKTTD